MLKATEAEITETEKKRKKEEALILKQAEKDRDEYEKQRKRDRTQFWLDAIMEGLRYDDIDYDADFEDIDDEILPKLCRKFPNSEICKGWRREQRR